MNSLELLQHHLDMEQEALNKKYLALTALPELAKLTFDVSSTFSSIDFDCLSHVKVIEVIKVFGGKWTKEVSGFGITYTTTKNEIKIRCWQSEPPPNCKIVVQDEFVPAHTRQVRTIECKPDLTETVEKESVTLE